MWMNRPTALHIVYEMLEGRLIPFDMRSIEVMLESIMWQQMVVFYRVDGAEGDWEMDCEVRLAPGGERYPIQRLSFQLPGDTGTGRYTFTLADCPWDEVALPVAYTRISQFAQSVAVDLGE